MKNSAFIDCLCDVNVMNVRFCRKSVGTEKVAPLASSPLLATVTRVPPVLRLREGEVGLEHTHTTKEGNKVHTVIHTVKIISMSEKGFVTAVEFDRFHPGSVQVEDRKYGPLVVSEWLLKRNLAKDDKWRSNSSWFLHDNIRQDFKTLQGFLKVCPRVNGSADNAMGTTVAEAADMEDADMSDVEAESIPRVRDLRVSLRSVVVEHGAREVAAADTAGADVNALDRHDVGAGARGTEDAVDESGNPSEG